jgi:hypothetical protein
MLPVVIFGLLVARIDPRRDRRPFVAQALARGMPAERWRIASGSRALEIATS